MKNPITIISDQDPFQLYFQNLNDTTKEKSVFTPTSIKEIPPLVNMTGWHHFLKDYIQSKGKVNDLITLIGLPEGVEKLGCYGHISDLVISYMKNIRQKAMDSSPSVLILLMECPRLVLNL